MLHNSLINNNNVITHTHTHVRYGVNYNLIKRLLLLLYYIYNIEYLICKKKKNREKNNRGTWQIQVSLG